jgi:peptide/nickel transport system permease protein
MTTYIIRRLLLMVPVLLLVVGFVFLLMRLLPGDAVDLLVEDSPFIRDEDRQAMRERLGLDDPIPVQFVHWLGDALRGDFGRSFTSSSEVSELIRDRGPLTAELAVMAMVIAVAIGVPAGIIAAVAQDSIVDYIVRAVAIAGLTVPSFVIGTAVLVYASKWFGWSPPLGYTTLLDDPWTNLKQFFLPALVLGASLSASSMRMMRSQMLEVLRMDYVRTARAKGQRERRIVVRHAMPNAINPVMTIIGNQVSFLIGGALIIEVLFSLPGLGRTLYDAIVNRDYPVVQALVALTALLLLLINLIVDISYAIFDPRIRYR